MLFEGSTQNTTTLFHDRAPSANLMQEFHNYFLKRSVMVDILYALEASVLSFCGLYIFDVAFWEEFQVLFLRNKRNVIHPSESL